MSRPDKAAAVAELADQFRESSGAVLTEYRGLSVQQLQELRRTLGADATYSVVKNTLTKIAAQDAGVDAFDSLLSGPSAIAFITGDVVLAAKGLRDFARANPPLVIKGGLLEGRALSAGEVARLADLESREVLLAKLAGAMSASLQQAVNLFTAPLGQMARAAAALQRQAEDAAPAAGEEPADSAPAPNPEPADAPDAPDAPDEPAPTPDSTDQAETQTPERTASDGEDDH